MKRLVFGSLAVLALFTAGAPALALDVGDEAPELEVTDWLKGGELQIEPGKVYVIQFFATFNSDCRAVIPTLTELQDKYRDKGLEIVGITEQSASSVKSFVENNELSYRLASDQYKNTSAAYMEGVTQIPYAFVINRTRRLAWKGDPRQGMKDVLEKVVEGKFDIDLAIKISERTAALGRENSKRDNDDGRAKAAEELLEVEPFNNWALGVRLDVFENKDDVEGYRAYLRKHVVRIRDNQAALLRLTSRLLDAGGGGFTFSGGTFTFRSGGHKWRDIEVAHKAVKRAVELSESKDDSILDVYAQVLFEIGLLDDAIKTLKKAIDVGKENDARQQRLDYYKSVLELRKALRK